MTPLAPATKTFTGLTIRYLYLYAEARRRPVRELPSSAPRTKHARVCVLALRALTDRSSLSALPAAAGEAVRRARAAPSEGRALDGCCDGDQLAQLRDVRVGILDLSALAVKVGVLTQQPARYLKVVRPADCERRDELRVLDVPGRELAVVAPSAPPDLVPVARGADVLHARPVREVRPEVRHDVVLLLLPEHVESGVFAVVEGDVPVLDPDAAAMDDAVVLGDVPGREHTGRAGLEVTVGEHPFVRLDPGLLGEVHVRMDSGTDHDEVAFDLEPRLCHDPANPPVAALEALELL